MKRLLLLVVGGCLFTSSLPAAEIRWQRDWQTATRVAAIQQKPLLVMVSADWCGPCRRMLKQTFPDPRIAARVNVHFVPVILDADEDAELLERWQIEGTPTVLILDPRQRELGRHAGFQTAPELDVRLARLTPKRQQPLALGTRPPINVSAWQHLQQPQPARVAAPQAPRTIPVVAMSRPAANAFGATIRFRDTLTAAQNFGRTEADDQETELAAHMP